ncbi:hypothetical protein C7T35_07960 [Variovorax sp. WS11]|uniref:hypothetical protein n=1 Tax=Variovorax sp. WS11 TaxID=1105204 RepID=UPI000D0E061B|nr:hypothetical protein [Variovorax sp. WS11]NDZ18498.1 hypothetical protein [Variovorax sp. WS11]PSL85136.1 hypothetical protein C7T35_07960 [Variovorax sp. WS11]
MVNIEPPTVAGRHGTPAPRTRNIARLLFAALVGLSLASGVAGGLWRLGVAVPDPASFPRTGQVLLAHAALRICGFLGTVIGIERAVAVRHRAAFLAPLASGTGALCLMLGEQALGAWLVVAAALLFLAVNAAVVRRQPAPHTLLLLAGAGAWVAGSLLFALGQGGHAVFPWWFAFLIMTIAAERLEMTRLMRRRPAADLMLHAVLTLLLAGAAWSIAAPRAGGLAYGTALVLLAAWLASFDVARRTVFAHGLARYMAICLLGGYAWLGVAGAAWAAMALGWDTRDAALHALGLGFILSMMMGHAPVVLPSIARVKLRFGAFFYLPLAVLHLSLLVRLVLGSFSEALRATGAFFNAATIGFFAATVAGAAVAWRLQHGAAGAGKSR